MCSSDLIKIYKDYEYNTEPTKLTKQIEEITNYKIRKQKLEEEKKELKNTIKELAAILKSRTKQKAVLQNRI